MPRGITVDKTKIRESVWLSWNGNAAAGDPARGDRRRSGLAPCPGVFADARLRGLDALGNRSPDSICKQGAGHLGDRPGPSRGRGAARPRTGPHAGAIRLDRFVVRVEPAGIPQYRARAGATLLISSRPAAGNGTRARGGFLPAAG